MLATLPHGCKTARFRQSNFRVTSLCSCSANTRETSCGRADFRTQSGPDVCQESSCKYRGMGGGAEHRRRSGSARQGGGAFQPGERRLLVLLDGDFDGAFGAFQQVFRAVTGIIAVIEASTNRVLLLFVKLR